MKDLDLSNYIKKITDLHKKAVEEENIVAVNTIIEILLFIQERRIDKIETKQISTIDYKQMLAAA